MTIERTKHESHRATERGYAGGELIEPGEFVPADVPIGSWMEGAESAPASVKRSAGAKAE